MFTPTETATNPSLKTVSYGIAPGAADEEIDVQSEEMLVNMGPQHPSTHGVLRIVLRTDGEMVLEAVPHLGYLHRCKEKIGENQVLSNRDKKQHSDERGQDSREIQNEQLQDNAGNRLSEI